LTALVGVVLHPLIDLRSGAETSLAVYTLPHVWGLELLEEITMKKLMAFCFALSLVTFVVAPVIASAQDAMGHDTMKNDDASKKAIDVKGKISDDGKTFVSDKDKKSWTIINPDAVKGHEGHHVILNAHVYPDKMEVHVMSLKMAK
jgi:hypothetical protein